MDLSQHTTASSLERYAFYWLLGLLVFSAGALFLGGRPPILLVVGYSASMVWSLLNLAWIICGVAGLFLGYQWVQHGKQVFGGSDTKDQVAFGFMILAGLNLGITGALGNNIFFYIFMGQTLFVLVGVACLGVAGYLYKRWQDNDETLFVSSAPATPVESPAVPGATPEQSTEATHQE